MAEEDGKCHHRKAAEAVPPLFQHGSVVFQAHHVGWIVSGFFALVACGVSFWLIDKHLVWYTNKREQRHIVRILFMVPIYALISFASYIFWNTATPLILLRDSYESIVLASFFYLLLLYVSNDYDGQRLVFLRVGISKQADQAAIQNGEKVQTWCWPLGSLKKKPSDGLYFLQIMKWGILQYSVLRPVTTLAAVILEYAGLYCEISWGPQWGHLWVVLIVSLSVTVAMYCLIQLYLPISERLKPRKPLLKLFAIKAVVFLTFWQASFLSLLSTLGVVKDGKYMTAEQINIGFGALLQTFEMMIFAFMHVNAFSYRPYRPDYSKEPKKHNRVNPDKSPTSDGSPQGKTPRLRSLGHAMNFYETFREIWQGWLYMYDRIRGREPRYDANARRAAHLDNVFGVLRPSGLRATPNGRMVEGCDESLPIIKHDQNTHYRLVSVARETSEAFSAGVERELERRGLGPGARAETQQELHDPNTPHRRRSWWRNIYTRLSQSGHDEDEAKLSQAPSRCNSRPHHRSRNQRRSRGVLSEQDNDEYNDPPLAGIPHAYSRTYRYEISTDRDDLVPLSSYSDHHGSYPHPKRNQKNSPDSRQKSIALGPTQGQGLSINRTPMDNSFGRVFPPSDIASTINHHPSTVPHSEKSESHNGHSASRWKTPGPNFVSTELQIRSVMPKLQPQVQHIEGSQVEIIYYDPDEDIVAPTRPHIRQYAETHITPPRSSVPQERSPLTSPSPDQPPRMLPSLHPRRENRIPGQQYWDTSSLHPAPIVTPPSPAIRNPLRTPRILTVPAPLSKHHQVPLSYTPGNAPTSNSVSYMPGPKAAIYGLPDQESPSHTRK